MVLLQNGDLNGFATKHDLHKAVYHKMATVLLKSAILYKLLYYLVNTILLQKV
jgi:hypothetical protein